MTGGFVTICEQLSELYAPAKSFPEIKLSQAQRIDAQSDFLQGRYDEAEGLFRALLNSKDPLFRSHAYALLIRLYAEMGEYHNALEVADQGIAIALETGDSSHRADRLLDRAYLNCSLGHYASCMHDLQLSLEIESGWQRSLTAATLLGQFSSCSDAITKQRFVRALSKIENRLPPDQIQPLSDIVRARVRGEILLSQGRWQAALDVFRKTDRISPPLSDKSYFGRALLIAAEHARDEISASQLREEARRAYAVIALRPGLAWQWPVDLMPGVVSDAELAYAEAASRLNRREDVKHLSNLTSPAVVHRIKKANRITRREHS